MKPNTHKHRAALTALAGLVVTGGALVAAAPAQAAAAPTISGLTLRTGPTAGAVTVDISGSGLTGVRSVAFGSARARSVDEVTAGVLRVAAPAHAAGRVRVTIATSHGTTASTAADVFTYTAGPYIRTLPLSGGSVRGGSTVTIVGNGFAKVRSVAFGSVQARSWTVRDSRRIVAVAPAHPAGPVRISVAAASGTSPSVPADVFSYGHWSPTALPVLPRVRATEPVGERDLACPTTTSCVAVGTQGFSGDVGSPTSKDEERGFVQTLRGGTWRVRPAPVPTGAGTVAYSELNRVACASSGSCAALGVVDGSGGRGGVLDAWDGSTWTAQFLPDLDGRHTALLPNAVACDSPGSCTAVGGDGVAAVVYTLRDGTWTASALALPADAVASDVDTPALSDVSCPATGSCVAVGRYRTAHGDRGLIATLADGTWTSRPAPLPAKVSPNADSILYEVSCAGSVCAADGSHGTTTMLLARTAGSWSAVDAARPSGATSVTPHDVSCAGGVCRVGLLVEHAYPRTSDYAVATRSGSTWNTAVLPVPPARSPYAATGVLDSVSCAGSVDCLVTGGLTKAPTDSQEALYEHTASGWGVTVAALPADLGAVPAPSAGASSCPSSNACRVLLTYTGAGGIPRAAVVTNGG